jgi:large subunit ribosomal protein L21
MYAIIKTGGKQYRVSPGDVLRVEKLAGATGSTVEFPALAVAVDGEVLRAGNSVGKVSATIVREARAKKVIVFKIKRKKQYKRTSGHRQSFTSVKIGEIVAGQGAA